MRETEEASSTSAMASDISPASTLRPGHPCPDAGKWGVPRPRLLNSFTSSAVVVYSPCLVVTRSNWYLSFSCEKVSRLGSDCSILLG